MHIKYPKIRRLNTDECEWILNWECIIEEKIDWANLSVWLEDWHIFVGSRTQTVWTNEKKEWFSWAVQYINNHEWIKKLLTKNPTRRLYWERLVQHTIQYNPQHYNKFYMYDILVGWDEEQPEFLNPVEVIKIADEYNIEHPKLFGTYTNPTIEQLESFFKEPNLWEKMEWVVIKNTSFINKFWRPQYAKLVSDQFKEENSIIFWNSNKYDELETRWAIKRTTPGRFMKMLNKIEQQRWEKFKSTNISEMLWRIQYDIISEEIPSACGNYTVNFGKLKKKILDITRTMCLQFLDKGLEAPIFIYNQRDEKDNHDEVITS
jgi:hypothetical protein